MAVNLSPVGGVAAQFFDNDGNVLSGGKIYTYTAGSSTPAVTYTNAAGVIQHSNPIILDSAGRVPTGEIWLTDGIQYKFVIKNASDTLIGTYDNIIGINSNFLNFLAEQEIQTATAGQTVFTLTTTQYQPGTNTLSVFVDGVNQYGPGAQYAYTETSSTVVTFVNGLHVGALVKFTTTQTLSGGTLDSSQVIYNPPFTGGVETTVEAKLSQYVNVKDFGAVGDGVTDDTAAIQAALSAAKFIDFGNSSNNYKIFGSLTVQSGTSIFGGFPTITQTKNLTQIFDIVGKTDISITGISFVGVGTDYAESDANPYATAVYSNSGEARIQIKGNKFTNFAYASVRFKAATDIQFCNNIVVGVTVPVAGVSGRSYGFLADYGCDRILVSGNTISKGGQGLRIESASNLRVSDNYIYNIIGQHGMYFGSNMQNLAVTGNNVKSTGLMGIKVQAQNDTVNSNNIAITGNTITSTGDQGIAVLNASGSTVQAVQNFNVTITGNTLADITATAINIQNTNIATIGNNSIYQANGSGVNLSACTFIDVSNNVINDIEYSGIRDEAPCTNVNITENILNNCATGAHAGDAYGIFIQSGTALEISSNTITDGSANMIYGVFIAGGSQPTQSIFNNQIFNSTAQAIRFASSTDELAMYVNNLLIGTAGASNNNPDIPDVTAAATITLSTAQNVFRISGTTGITSIDTAGHTGHQVTLIFASTPTVTDGSNLILAGSFTATANDTLTLACDGSNWYEIARSVN